MSAFPERILVRGVNWLGDAVMSTPALQRLREAAPNSEITLLTHAKLADLFRDYPHVNQVITFDGTEGLFSLARRLRRMRFQMAFVLPNSTRSALETLLARIPQRVGYGRGWLLTRSLPNSPIRMRKRSTAEINSLIAKGNVSREKFPTDAHHVHNYLRLIPAPWTEPRLHVKDDEVAEARKRLPNQRLWLGLNPGAEYGPAKRWPLERFVETANRLHKKLNCGWILFGGPNDAPLTAQIAAGCAGPIADLAGKTTLRELCALFRCCKVLLTNDTGPMHVAAALKVPVVAPFGSTAPELTGPPAGAITGNVPCAPCFRRECPIDFRCMRSIEVDQVVAETLKVCV
ncbi:MAG TPA: lipopolysaccharide heptosyltransferase II [Verrucomicrobiae bacterium]|nr:lipopolysaccharide heptosyltransferase II [Verrucomicrobiae bacterium]